MARAVEQSVREFYDERGWKGSEDRLFRQHGRAYQRYHAAADARTIDCFAGRDGSLLIACGGDMPESHVTIATKFEKVSYIDISDTALKSHSARCRNSSRSWGRSAMHRLRLQLSTQCSART